MTGRHHGHRRQPPLPQPPPPSPHPITRVITVVVRPTKVLPTSRDTPPPPHAVWIISGSTYYCVFVDHSFLQPRTHYIAATALQSQQSSRQHHRQHPAPHAARTTARHIALYSIAAASSRRHTGCTPQVPISWTLSCTRKHAHTHRHLQAAVASYEILGRRTPLYHVNTL